MNVLRNIGAVLAGIVLGSIVNMALVSVGPSIIPLPEGADVSTMESLAESMKLMKPANYLFPFLGHALGALVGAFVAARIATTKKMWFALGLGAWFLIGGIAAAAMLGGAVWFNALDLIVAYLPMGWLGGKLAGGTRQTTNVPAPEIPVAT